MSKCHRHQPCEGAIAMAAINRKMKALRQGGQVAVMFVVIIALIIALGAFTMNLGEVARLKTSTANAADAGALAAASWIASGQNEVAKIAQGMWINVYLVQAVFVFPFCLRVCHWAVILMAVLALVNGLILRDIANEALHGAWDRARADAFFIAVQNLLIDDASGGVQDRLKQMGKTFEDDQRLPTPEETGRPSGSLAGSHWLQWRRSSPSGDGSDRTHWVAIHTSFSSSRPELTMSNWGPWGFCLIRWGECQQAGPTGGAAAASCCIRNPWGAGCIWPCFSWTPSWVTWGGKKKEAVKAPAKGTAVRTGEKVWDWTRSGLVKMVGFLPRPWPTSSGGDLGTCNFCLPIPINILQLPTKPGQISHGRGEVTVTVQYHREGGLMRGGTGVPFWTSRYPTEITSESTAHYTDASVSSLPKAKAYAELSRPPR